MTFITPRVKTCIMGLETKFILKPDIFTFLKLMRNVVSEAVHLRRANFRANSSLASLGRVAQLFQNVMTRPLVLQCRYGLSFTVSFLKSYAPIRSKNPYINV